MSGAITGFSIIASGSLYSGSSGRKPTPPPTIAPTKTPGKMVRVMLDIISLIGFTAAIVGPLNVFALKNPYMTRKLIAPMNTETPMLT